MVENEPLRFTQGDSISWKIDLKKYPSPKWSLNYFVRGPSVLDITSKSGENGSHLLQITSDQSGFLLGGNYWWEAVVKSGNARTSLRQGQFFVAKSLENSSVNFDGRSAVKRTLDSLEAVIEKRASKDQMAYSIAGRSLSLMTIDDLLKWRAKYVDLYKKERRAEYEKNNGVINSNVIIPRF